MLSPGLYRSFSLLLGCNSAHFPSPRFTTRVNHSGLVVAAGFFEKFCPIMTSIAETFKGLMQAFLSLPRNIQAILNMLVAIVCFTAMAATVKFLGQDLHVTGIVVVRQGFMVLFLLPAMLKATGGQIRINRIDLFALRAFLTFFSILAAFTAIIELPLATATTLSFTRTFFVTIFAVLILHETVGSRRIGALIVGFSGILIIARPMDLLTGGWQALDINMLFALVSSATIAASQILVKIHSRYDQPTVLVFAQAFVIGLAMLPLAYFHWITPTPEQIVLIAITAALASVAQWLVVHAFKVANATTLAPIDYVRLIVSTAFGWFLFSEWPDAYTWLGALIIFASTFYIVRREAKLNRLNKDARRLDDA